MGRNDEPFEAPIDGYLSVNGPSMSYFSEVIGLEAVPRNVADVNASKKMNFTSNFVLHKTPKFVDLGLLPANTADKINSVFTSAIRAEGLTESSNWPMSRHGIVEVAEGIMSEVKAYID